MSKTFLRGDRFVTIGRGREKGESFLSVYIYYNLSIYTIIRKRDGPVRLPAGLRMVLSGPWMRTGKTGVPDLGKTQAARGTPLHLESGMLKS